MAENIIQIMHKKRMSGLTNDICASCDNIRHVACCFKGRFKKK